MAGRLALRRTTSPLDVALAAALVAAVVVESLGRPEASHDVAHAGLGALAVASVAIRRTLPGTAAAVLAIAMTAQSLAAEAPDETATLVACVLISWSVAVHAPRREAVLGVALVALGVSVAIATDPSDSITNIPPTLLLFVGFPSGLGLVLRRRQQDVAALTLETQALAREADLAVESERRRIARELHDVVSHAVTLIAVQAEAGQAVIGTDPEAARRSLDAIGRVSREALDELHRLLAVLHEDDAPPDREPGLALLPSLVQGARAAGLAVTVSETGSASLDGPVDSCAYRVVQEALTNALRHTSDADVDVVVDRTDDRARITVTSHGRRHASAYGGTGRGLAGLRERVTALGGTFHAAAAGERGFEVRVELPLAPAAP